MSRIHPNNHHVGSLTDLVIGKLPSASLRSTAEALLQAEHDPERSAVVRMISRDPLIAAWVLRRANSAYYGLRSRVDSVVHAVDLLQPSVVARMILYAGDAVHADDHDTTVGETALYASLSRHALATAIIADRLDTERANAPGLAYTAGLLHDAGKNVFALNFQGESTALYGPHARETLSDRNIEDVERASFGLDHVEVGEYLARKMRLPDTLAEIVRWHHNPEHISRITGSRRIGYLVFGASLSATALGYAAGVSVSWEQCAGHDCWDRIVDYASDDRSTPGTLLDDIHGLLHELTLTIDEHEKPNRHSTPRPETVDRKPVGNPHRPSGKTSTEPSAFKR